MIVPLCEYFCYILLISADGYLQPEEKEKTHDPSYDYGIRRVSLRSSHDTSYDIPLIQILSGLEVLKVGLD